MTIILIIALTLTLVALGVSIWYIINCLRKIQFISQSVEDVDVSLIGFEKHLKSIYELDMYYGDETLENLISHMKELTSSFTDFRKDYEIFNNHQQNRNQKDLSS